MTGAAPDGRVIWLLLATFLVAVAGLIYELIAATVSSYLLGDSVRQFSFVIGIFLASMGLGAWLSRYVSAPVQGFVLVQILLGVVGGAIAPVIFFAYGSGADIAFILYGMLAAIGVFSGMEIPLIARLLVEVGAPKFRFENVLSLDYAGALIAALAFPLVILPMMSLVAASLLFGVLNLAVAGGSIWLFRDRLALALKAGWGVATITAVMALFASDRLVSQIDARLFEQDIILSESTPYQKITVTRWFDRTRLFLNHSIQFDTYDEHRYHEMLVHPALSNRSEAKRVLILGGGDGMAAREVLKYEHVQTLTLVDLDPRMTELFRDYPELTALNAHAFHDPRVEIINKDAWAFLEAGTSAYDLVILDLPDPKNVSLSRLYTRAFYARVANRLSPDGLIATHAGSPTFAPDAFWSIVTTLEATQNPWSTKQRLQVTPYHAYLPSFGDWGFVVVSLTEPIDSVGALPIGLKFVAPDTFQAAKVFPPDAARRVVAENKLQSHALVSYYSKGWDRWFK